MRPKDFLRGILARYHGDVKADVVRRMALDVGDRRIGIAVTDRLGMTVHGRPTRVRTNLDADVLHICGLVGSEGVGEVVVGLPRHMDGKRSRQTEKTEVFADRRYVDNGAVILSAGISAGMDMSLHVISRLHGLAAAERTARHMEYEWKREPTEKG